MNFYNAPYLATTGSIATPATGFVTLFMKDDGLLYIKRPDGTESRIS